MMKLLVDYKRWDNPQIEKDRQEIIQNGGAYKTVTKNTTFLDVEDYTEVETKEGLFKNGFESHNLGADGMTKYFYDDKLPKATHFYKDARLFLL